MPQKTVNQMSLIGRVTHSLMGYRDILLVPEKKLFFSVTSDMSMISRLDSKITNMNMPWDKHTDQVLLSVGVLEAWLQSKRGMEEYTYERLWYKNFGSQAICIHYDSKLGYIFTGCDNGVVAILEFSSKSALKYKEVAEQKIHQKRVMGIASDSRRKVMYSIGEDKFFIIFNLKTNSISAGEFFGILLRVLVIVNYLFSANLSFLAISLLIFRIFIHFCCVEFF